MHSFETHVQFLSYRIQDKFALCWATTFLIICNSSHRKDHHIQHIVLPDPQEIKHEKRAMLKYVLEKKRKLVELLQKLRDFKARQACLSCHGRESFMNVTATGS